MPAPETVLSPPAPPLTFGRPMLDHWLLDPDVLHLNHGTVGATPRCVLDEQARLRDEIERNPARFLLRELAGAQAGGAERARNRLREAAEEVAAFFGVRGEDLMFTDNTTTAANAVLRSFDFRPDDEIVLFDHSYGALRKTAEYVARRAGAHVRIAEIPFPGTTEAGVLRALEGALTARTRLAILDHITAPSALLLPLAEMAALCRRRGIAVFGDGAHAPGAIPLDIGALGVDWYAGNLHKWGWAPRSSAILWVDRARQEGLHPTTISWGLDQGVAAEFDWVGTRDPTPYLAAPAALAFMKSLGVERVQRHNHELAWEAGQLLARRWGTELPAPETMVGTMVAVRVPEGAGSTFEAASRLRDALLFEEGIEVHLPVVGDALFVRVSAQIYNEISDVERLAEAVLRRV